MAEQLKGLAATANSELYQASAQPLGPSFRPALNTLYLREIQMGTLARGHPVPLQEIDLVGPTTNLERASGAIARYNELHNKVTRIFSIYGGVLGALTDGQLWQGDLALHAAHPEYPLWQRWVHHRADALHRIDQASQRLRSAAAYDLATVDAFNLAQSFPDNPQARIAWMWAADNLADRAEAEADAASSSEGVIHRAVSAEYDYGLAILNR